MGGKKSNLYSLDYKYYHLQYTEKFKVEPACSALWGQRSKDGGTCLIRDVNKPQGEEPETAGKNLATRDLR